MFRTVTTTVLVVAVGLIGSCATPANNPFSGGDGPDGATGNATPQRDSAAVRRITGTENGLAIRKWVIEDDERRIRSVLMRHAIGGVLHDQADQRLQRNGFRLIRVPVEHVDSILRELGGATMDVTAWHGQVYQWRTLSSRAIGGEGQPIAIDGRVRRFPPGEMRLVMRSWIVGMEDGPRVQFELVPQFYLPRKRELNVLVRNEPPQPVESYPSMAVDQLLEDDAAYILTCALPQSDWNAAAEEDGPNENGEPTSPQPSRDQQRQRLRRAGGMGPGPGVGPDAAPPRTIGQWMFSNDIGRPSRVVFVLLPRIADHLHPPRAADAAAAELR